MNKKSLTIFFIGIGLIGVVLFVHPQEFVRPIETAPLEVVPLPEVPQTPPLSYKLITLSSDAPGKEIVDAIGGYEHLSEVLSLNRIDDKHLQKGMEITIPSTFENTRAFTGFPATLPEAVAIPKVFLIAQRTQEFGAYEYGQLVRFGGISTGKKSTPTKNGLYHTNWKAKETISTVNDEWLLKWNFNIDNFGGIGIHEYELPGYPASHSCIRLSALDAQWFYEWADQWTLSPDEQTILQKGTPVIIFGAYDYTTKAPWKKLAEDQGAITISAEEISTFAPLLAQLPQSQVTE